MTMKVKIFNSGLTLHIQLINNYTEDIRQVTSIYQQMPGKNYKYTPARQNIRQRTLWKNCRRASVGAAEKEMELSWTHPENQRQQHHWAGTTVHKEQSDLGMHGIGMMKKKCGWHRYSWKMMEVIAQDSWMSHVVCGLCFTRSDKA